MRFLETVIAMGCLFADWLMMMGALFVFFSEHTAPEAGRERERVLQEQVESAWEGPIEGDSRPRRRLYLLAVHVPSVL